MSLTFLRKRSSTKLIPMKRIRIISLLIIGLFAVVISCSKSGNNGNTGNYTNNYVVFAWNDLGMHCINATYDKLVILPPYNNLWVQVVKRGAQPEIVTQGISVEYKIINNTYSYGKRQYGGFWDYCLSLFGVNLAHDVGLKNNGLSGIMVAKTDHFVIEGIPVTPVDDNNVYNPLQVAEITVKDGTGNIIAQTRATVPVSDEINCAKCHGSDSFTDILTKHDDSNGTSLLSSTPVLCAKCHGSPALGTTGAGTSGLYLSQAIHGFHSDKNANCYDCHPGNTTKCSRSARHTAPDGNCTTCHGQMNQVASSISSGRMPWGNEPKCSTCHQSIAEIETGSTLYRNATGHGEMYCAACHGSPHAMVPSLSISDNYQSRQYQNGKDKSMGSCGVCHRSSRGEENDISDFAEVHGGPNPEEENTCYICHNQVSSTISKWPHSYQWNNSNAN